MDIDPLQDSLFGSPPPEQGIGRSPSPLLALPPSGTSHRPLWSQNENVGTIALPGSQPFAELSDNPLASPMSSMSQSTASPLSVPTCSLSPTRASSASMKPAVKKRSRVTSRRSPFTPGPTVILPDSSGPPPLNFLRNQEGLLGTAGLVSGVRPSQITVKTPPPGSLAQKPIVVNNEQVPLLSTEIHLPPEQPTLSQNALPCNIQFPAPNRKAIIASLVKMPDLTRVLEELIKLSLSPQTSYQPTSFREAMSHDGQARKRRKLDKVPAGAADWDVPFPFEYGHGPSQYMANWAEERRKTLIGQLIALVTTATKKAAAKEYCKQHGVKAFADLVNRVSCGNTNAVKRDYTSHAVSAPTPSSFPSSNEELPTEDGGLDSLLSSLLAAVPTPGRAPSDQEKAEVADQAAYLTFQDVNSLSSNETVMDDWMTIFSSFSIPDKAPPGYLFPVSTPTPDSMGTPTFDDALASLLAQTELPPIQSGSNSTPTSSVPLTNHLDDFSHAASTPPAPIPSYLSDAHHMHESTKIPSTNIDPTLLALSGIPLYNGETSSASSPLASQSSLGPLTPQSSTWELGDMTPQMAPIILDHSQSRTGSGTSYSAPLLAAPDAQRMPPFPAPTEEAVAALRSILEESTKLKGKQRLSKDAGATSRQKQGRAAEIIRAAKERKRMLEVELERAKVEYWEMAIEQSAMMHLLQKL